MSTTTEQLKFEMYEQLSAIRKARKHPIMLRNFEDDLEAYLEALRRQVSEADSALGTYAGMVEQGAVKLARASLTILALHRVIKDQQKAQDRLQEGLDEAVQIINLEKSKVYAEAEEAIRQIMQAEAVADERYEMLEGRQKLIVKQRKTIESLTFELASAQYSPGIGAFFARLWRKSNAAKPLPK